MLHHLAPCIRASHYNVKHASRWHREYCKERKKYRLTRINARSIATFNSARSRRYFLDNLTKHLNPYTALTLEKVIQHGGSSLMLMYGKSTQLMIATEYPETAWTMWEFASSPKQWWRELGKLWRRGDPIAELLVRRYIEEIVTPNLSPNTNEWFLYWTSIIQRKRSLPKTSLNRLAWIDDYVNILRRLYPHYSWKASDQVYQHATDIENIPATNALHKIRVKLDAMVAKMGGSLESIYELNNAHFKLLDSHDQQQLLTLMAAYPEHPWRPWRFRKTPRHWWRQVSASVQANIVSRTLLFSFLEDIATELGVSVAQLPEVPKSSFSQTRLVQLKYFGGIDNVWTTLVFNEYQLEQQHTIVKLARNADRKSCREFLDQFTRTQGGGKDWDRLYSVTGHLLLRSYGNSAGRTILGEFPEHGWKPWKFPLKGWWDHLARLIKQGDAIADAVLLNYLDSMLEEKPDPSEWITPRHLAMMGMTLESLLSRYYPEKIANAMLPSDLSFQARVKQSLDALLP